eukprot:364059-Chlamydomonas_euryale.AAC.7
MAGTVSHLLAGGVLTGTGEGKAEQHSGGGTECTYRQVERTLFKLVLAQTLATPWPHTATGRLTLLSKLAEQFGFRVAPLMMSLLWQQNENLSPDECHVDNVDGVLRTCALAGGGDRGADAQRGEEGVVRSTCCMSRWRRRRASAPVPALWSCYGRGGSCSGVFAWSTHHSMVTRGYARSWPVKCQLAACQLLRPARKGASVAPRGGRCAAGLPVSARTEW